MLRRTFITRRKQDFYCLFSIVGLIRAARDGVRKIAREALLKTSPEGGQIYGERAIKSLYKDTAAEFLEYSVYKACVAQVNDAGGIR